MTKSRATIHPTHRPHVFAAWRLADLLARQGHVDELRARADAEGRFAAERLAKLFDRRSP